MDNNHPEALRQLRQVIPFRVALECKHQEPVGNLRVILESAERAASEVDYLLASLRTQHALLERARDALEQVTVSETFYKDPRGDTAGPVIAAINQHLKKQ